jgi:hypothetical protein
MNTLSYNKPNLKTKTYIHISTAYINIYATVQLYKPTIYKTVNTILVIFKNHKYVYKRTRWPEGRRWLAK